MIFEFSKKYEEKNKIKIYILLDYICTYIISNKNPAKRCINALVTLPWLMARFRNRVSDVGAILRLLVVHVMWHYYYLDPQRDCYKSNTLDMAARYSYIGDRKNSDRLDITSYACNRDSSHERKLSLMPKLPKSRNLDNATQDKKSWDLVDSIFYHIYRLNNVRRCR